MLLFTPAAGKSAVFVEAYSYDAGEADSKLTCRAISLVQVKKLLLEKIGVYLEAETEVVNYQLTREQITALTAGIVKTEIVSESWNGQTYQLTAKIEADPDQVAAAIDELRKSREGKESLSKIEDVNAQSMAKIEELKAELSALQKNIIDINRDYQESAQLVTAWQAFENGNRLMIEGKYEDALSQYNQAVAGKPTYMHYFSRGKAYARLERFEDAIQDFTRAIELSPNFSHAYFYRGRSLKKIGSHKKGKQDIIKAAELGNGQAKQWLKMKEIYWLSR